MLTCKVLPLLTALFSPFTAGIPIAQDDHHVPYFTLEEHWLSPSLAELFAANPLNTLFGAGAVAPKLKEIGPNRLASMDAANIHIQVISHVPVPEILSMLGMTQVANDELAEAIKASPAPERFRGFCTLPMALPMVAAEELHRCVREHGFVGALVDSHLSDSTYYDGPMYDPLWKAAVELNVPIYLHPTYPALSEVIDVGTGLYAPSVEGEYSLSQAAALGMTAWGWHERTGMGFLRMYLGGVFDRFPQLQIILGHMGELVPYFLARSNSSLSMNRTTSLEDVYARNVLITTSGLFTLDPMGTVVRTTDPSRVMFSVDWPLSDNINGAKFMKELSQSGLVSEEGFRRIAYQNAQRLLRL